MIEALELLIPLTAIFLGTLMPVAIVWLLLRDRAERQRLIHDTALKLAEKGQPIPAELFATPSRVPADLRRGVVLVMFGAALSISLYEFGVPWTIGLIPVFMGIGFLIVWQLEKREQSRLN